MLPEPELIPIDQKDARDLNAAGISKDDITILIHEFADDIRARRSDITIRKPPALTKGEMDILEEGGVSGVRDYGDSNLDRTRGLAVIGLEPRRTPCDSLPVHDVG